MKVLLREDVPKLGKAGALVEVSKGYARNYLLPRSLAFIATKENERRVQAEAKRRAAKELERVESLKELAKLIAGKSVTIRARANEEQKLFGSVGPVEIAQALTAEHGARVEPSQVALDTPIKDIGVFDVKLRLAPEVEADIKVWVVQET